MGHSRRLRPAGHVRACTCSHLVTQHLSPRGEAGGRQGGCAAAGLALLSLPPSPLPSQCSLTSSFKTPLYMTGSPASEEEEASLSGPELSSEEKSRTRAHTILSRLAKTARSHGTRA
eukprot:2593778-Rhodomonas_salina.1